MAIECVTIDTCHLFDGNPILEQHKLRYRTIIERQDWDVPRINGMEYDTYDNPATIYLVWRGADRVARGVSRLYPADRPFMLKEVFPHMVNYQDIPEGTSVLEGSRFCVDNTIESSVRKQICNEIILAYLEYGMSNGIDKILGVMYPAYWRGLFEKYGWKPIWIGDPIQTPDGKKSRAAILPVNAEVYENVKSATGIYDPIISYSSSQETTIVKAA